MNAENELVIHIFKILISIDVQNYGNRLKILFWSTVKNWKVILFWSVIVFNCCKRTKIFISVLFLNKIFTCGRNLQYKYCNLSFCFVPVTYLMISNKSKVTIRCDTNLFEIDKYCRKFTFETNTNSKPSIHHTCTQYVSIKQH